MATVIDRLVIEGCNPMQPSISTSQPNVSSVSSANKPSSGRKSPRRYRIGNSPASTAISVPSETCSLAARKTRVGGSLPPSLLTISSKCPLEPRTSPYSNANVKGAAAVGNAEDKPAAKPVNAGTGVVGSETLSSIREDKENTEEVNIDSSSSSSSKKRPAGGKDMKTDGLPPGAASPMIRKMEYMALVRQARHGMSSTDRIPRRGREDPKNAKSNIKGQSDRFVVEGRPVTSRASAGSTRSSISISSRQSHKKTRFVGTPDTFAYSDSEVSSLGGDGHTDLTKLYHGAGRRVVKGPSSVHSMQSVRSTQSVRSVRSDSRLLALPNLTRGQSESAICVGDTNWAYAKARRTIDNTLMNGSVYNPDFDELAAVANNLLQVRQTKSAFITNDSSRGSKPNTPRSASSDTHVDQLKACLNVSGQPTSGSPRSASSRWPPQKHKLNEKRHVSSSSERALLYKRHKLMERNTLSRKYQFSSVDSYLNFNKLNPPPPPSPSVEQMQPEQVNNSEPDMRKSVALSNGIGRSVTNMNSSHKRGTYRAEATIITDLNEYFTIQTPRYGPKQGNNNVNVNSKAGPPPNTPASKTPRAPAPTPRTPAGSEFAAAPASKVTGPLSESNNAMGIMKTNNGVEGVNDGPGPAVRGSAGSKQGPVVSVPSADAESVTSSMAL